MGHASHNSVGVLWIWDKMGLSSLVHGEIETKTGGHVTVSALLGWVIGSSSTMSSDLARAIVLETIGEGILWGALNESETYWLVHDALLAARNLDVVAGLDVIDLSDIWLETIISLFPVDLPLWNPSD